MWNLKWLYDLICFLLFTEITSSGWVWKTWHWSRWVLVPPRLTDPPPQSDLPKILREYHCACCNPGRCMPPTNKQVLVVEQHCQFTQRKAVTVSLVTTTWWRTIRFGWRNRGLVHKKQKECLYEVSPVLIPSLLSDIHKSYTFPHFWSCKFFNMMLQFRSSKYVC